MTHCDLLQWSLIHPVSVSESTNQYHWFNGYRCVTKYYEIRRERERERERESRIGHHSHGKSASLKVPIVQIELKKEQISDTSG